MKAYKIKPSPEPIPLDCDGINPPPEQLPIPTLIEVRGRKEHEAILKDSDKMKELGLDPYYETMVYLMRWENWLEDEK